MSETQLVARSRRGRPKNSVNKRTLYAKDLLEQLGGTDPVAFLASLLDAETVELVETDAQGRVLIGTDGKPQKVQHAVTLDLKVQVATTLCTYLYPRLSAHQVQGEVAIPVEVHLPTAEILSDPRLSGALQDLALLMAQQEGEASKAMHNLHPSMRATMLGLDR